MFIESEHTSVDLVHTGGKRQQVAPALRTCSQFGFEVKCHEPIGLPIPPQHELVFADP